MNNKKLKKLINNPKKFISDSAFFKRVTTRNVNTHINIGFIVIGEDEELINFTSESIIAASKKAKSNNLEIKYISSNNQEGFISKHSNIYDAVESITSDFIKILHQGDIISTDFIRNLHLHEIDSNKVDLIITPLTNNIQTNNVDPIFSAIQPKIITGEVESSRITVLPLYSCLIFNRALFDSNDELPQGRVLSNELTSCINLLNKVELHNNNFHYVGNSFTSHSLGGRLYELFMATSMDATITLNCIRKITELNDRNVLSALAQRCGFYFTHCLVLSYLKNKKPDEILSCTEKKDIYAAIIILTNSLGVNLIKSFSSNNYNHVHKIGYLTLLNEKAPFNLCYPEDIENHQAKLKLVSQEKILPTITRNTKEITANHIKTKIYSIFDNDFSYETYIWIYYQSFSDVFSMKMDLKSASKIEFLISGKRFSNITIKQIDNYISKKNRVTQQLPLKVKALRYLSKNKIISKRYSHNWLFIDNDLRADDNAEHFYRYVFSNKRNINAFFLLSKKSNDWERLKNDGFRLIPFGGLRHRLALINSDMILSSHANPAITNYLPRKHFSDIFKHKFVFLQHGITKDDQSEWLNSRNISHLVTAAYPEFSDISNDGRYKYTSKETILSGFPRYDALYGKSINSKVILIMPTWRKSLTGEFIGKTSQRAKNPNFSTSQFCKMWGGLLSSENLKSLVEQHGYEVLYYPHPNLTDYKDDLGIPSYIDIVDPEKQSIQEIFKKTSVLVTDFSSVAFDVSYMNKSILYFQFDSDTFFAEHSYSKGYFDYEKHGFGPVVNNISDTIYELDLILKNQCIPTPKFQKRISNFFPYNDNKNSERLFVALTGKHSTSVDFSSIERKIHHIVNKFETDSLIEFITLNKVKISTPKDFELPIFRRMIISTYMVSTLMKSKELSELIINISKCKDIDGCYKWICDNDKLVKSSLDDILNKGDASTFTSVVENQTNIYYFINAMFMNISQIISDFINNNYQDCITRIFSISNASAIKLPKEIELVLIKSLLSIGDIANASKRAKLITFDEYEKSEICDILMKPTVDCSDVSMQTFISTNLATTVLSTESHIEFILAHGNANTVNYDELINHSRLSSSIVNNYIKYTYKKKNHQALNTIFLENERIEKLSRNDENITFRLYNDFIINGIESFLSSLLSLSGLTGFEASLERLVVKNAHVDLVTFYNIIEKTISQYSDLFSCAYIYKISLIFHKFNKPILAKKIISQYLMVQHEAFFSQPRNWGTDNDYQILINAANELNKIVEV